MNMTNDEVMAEVVQAADRLARQEIDKYNVPKKEHFILANQQGQRLAKILGADLHIVLLGTILMDLKIGTCLAEGRLDDHVRDSAQAAREFLTVFDLGAGVVEKVISCVEQHHGAKKYDCLEAEICANADCYRFLSPAGFMHAVLIFGGRHEDFSVVLDQIDYKLDEKEKILSLDICREELRPNYENFKNLIKIARQDS